MINWPAIPRIQTNFSWHLQHTISLRSSISVCLMSSRIFMTSLLPVGRAQQRSSGALSLHSVPCLHVQGLQGCRHVTNPNSRSQRIIMQLIFRAAVATRLLILCVSNYCTDVFCHFKNLSKGHSVFLYISELLGHVKLTFHQTPNGKCGFIKLEGKRFGFVHRGIVQQSALE